MLNVSLQHGETMAIPGRPFSRVARSVAGYGIATALMLVSPLVVFAPASVFHCAMRNGRRAAWVAAAMAVVLAGISVFLTQTPHSSADRAQTMMVYASFTVAVLSIAIPAMVVVPLVERREKFGSVVTLALICGAIGLVVTEMIMRAVSFSPYAVQLAEQTSFATARVTEYGPAASQNWLGRIGLWLLTHSPEVLPATVLLNFAIFFILSLMMFGRLSAWRAFAATKVADSETRRTYLFRNFALPDWLLFVFVIGGLTPLLSGMLQATTANVLTIMLCLYMLQGLAIFRFILVRANAGLAGGFFGFVLLAMLCLTGIGLLLLALAGLFDPFFDFRNLKRKDDSHESHTD